MGQCWLCMTRVHFYLGSNSVLAEPAADSHLLSPFSNRPFAPKCLLFDVKSLLRGTPSDSGSKMSYMLRHCLALTQVIALATSFPTRQIAASNDSIPTSQLFNRDDDIFDPTDLSFITKLAAIGDSYSAGIGSGDRLGTFLNALDPHSGQL